jgi:capsular exopolysaccharide synthesis family protein
MRKPKMVQDFKLTNEKGLSSYLVDICTFDEVVQKTEVENLDLISGGPVPPNPAELMLRPQMENFFKEARSKYEFVIVDSPPMAIVSDANNLTKHCDHLLFIVRQNYTQKDFLRSVDDFYRIGRIKDVSIVLNDIYKSGPGYGFGTGYGYGYGYSYRFASQKSKNGYGYYTENTDS